MAVEVPEPTWGGLHLFVVIICPAKLSHPALRHRHARTGTQENPTHTRSRKATLKWPMG